MVDSIKISNLTYADDGDLSPSDQFIVNDKDRSDGQTITRRTDLGDIVGYFTSSQLTFTNAVNFEGQVNFNDGVAFTDSVEFNNDVTLKGTVVFDAFTIFNGDIIVNGNISGVDLNDLDDVVVPSPINGNVLTWDNTQWIAGNVSGITPEGDDRYLVHVGDTPPSNPVDGMLWLHTVTASNPTRALKVYATISGTGKWHLTRPDGLLMGDGLASDRSTFATTTTTATSSSSVPSTSSSSGTPGEYA